MIMLYQKKCSLINYQQAPLYNIHTEISIEYIKLELKIAQYLIVLFDWLRYYQNSLLENAFGIYISYMALEILVSTGCLKIPSQYLNQY